MGSLQYAFLGVRGRDQEDAVVRRVWAWANRGTIRVVDVAYATETEDGSIASGKWTSLSDGNWGRLGAISGVLVNFGYVVSMGHMLGQARA